MQKCIEEEPTFSCRAQVDCCWVKVDILPHHTLDTDEYKQHRPLAPGSPHRLHTLYTIASLIRRNCLRHQHTIHCCRIRPLVLRRHRLSHQARIQQPCVLLAAASSSSSSSSSSSASSTTFRFFFSSSGVPANNARASSTWVLNI